MAGASGEDTKAAADKQNEHFTLSSLHWYSLWFAEIARVLYSRGLFETWIYITNPLKYCNKECIELLIKKWSLWLQNQCTIVLCNTIAHLKKPKPKGSALMAFAILLFSSF